MSNVEGLKELGEKLARIERATAIKSMRNACMAATLPVVKEMKAAAPKGNKVHRTYKGRLVAPGFLSRSVIRKTRVNKQTGAVSVRLGVKREAFYGVNFLDQGTKKIAGREWFVSRFEKNAGKMVATFKERLAKKIKQATA
ncbi:MAG: hypothetical protein GY800_13720 [Planctomycetes bacterium]|nr:hypothetical protein [Planctomycetota bacterium]